MTLSSAETGVALAAAADEALQLWRSALRQARPQVFPGLIDPLVETFARAVADTLAQGAPPENAWQAVSGVTRVLLVGEAEEVEAEWALAAEVLSAIGDALKAPPEVRQHALAAAREAFHRTLEIAESSGPTRGKVLAVRVL